jgi:hypothetical protein
MIDILMELNKLNKKIQFNMVDISTIECTLDASISTFVVWPQFKCWSVTKHLGPFLSKRWVDGVLRWGQQMAFKVHVIACIMERSFIEMIVWKSA